MTWLMKILRIHLAQQLLLKYYIIKTTATCVRLSVGALYYIRKATTRVAIFVFLFFIWHIDEFIVIYK